MFKKNNRITKNKEFEKTFKKGRSRYGNLIGIKLIANNLGFNRFGVVVGIKVSKKAVDRNRIKRKIREVFKKSKLKQGYDIVAIALPTIVDKEFTEIEKEIRNNLKKLNCLE